MKAKHSKFDPESPCLVLAPGLEYPLRSGGHILIDRKWSQFSHYVPFVDVLGNSTIIRYRKGEAVNNTRYENVEVPKVKAVFNTLIKRSHYWLQRGVTEHFVEAARPYFSNPLYRTVVFGSIFSAALIDELPDIKGRLYCIETHNDELKWFKDLRRSFANPLAKLVAYSSERWVRSFLSEHESDFLFLHLSRADQEGYLSRFPKLKSYVVPTGVKVYEEFLPQEDVTMLPDKVRLMFVGALGVKINFDAINFFKKQFYPTLRERLAGDLEVLVVGSNPSKNIKKICRSMNWRLLPNVSDQKLRDLYSTATFSILPFRYTTGSKLKLLDSLAHGVPYLATSALMEQAERVTYPCLISDDAEEWSRRVKEIKEQGITSREKVALIDQAKEYSWRSIAHRMFWLLDNDPGNLLTTA